MNLLTKQIISKFEKHPFHSQDGKGMDGEVLVKYFNACGTGTWLITEAEAERYFIPQGRIGDDAGGAIVLQGPFSDAQGLADLLGGEPPDSCRLGGERIQTVPVRSNETTVTLMYAINRQIR